MSERFDPWLALVASVPGSLAFASVLGLAMHRRAAALPAVIAAFVLIMGPPFAVAAARPVRRGLTLAGCLFVWATLWLFLVLPLLFPGERRESVAGGLAVLRLGDGWDRAVRRLAAVFPEEPVVAVPEPALAVATPEPEARAPGAAPIEDGALALPYEGEGSRLSVPVVFEHAGRSVELWMMVDTGATYTTLDQRALASLGLVPGPDAPVLELHTANGTTDARFAVADRVWLGDLPLDGVAVARCDVCAHDGVAGLLGLNVTGGFNVTIDADREEVVFDARETRDQQLDVAPFTDISATTSRFPGGRVEVEVSVENRGPRDVQSLTVSVSCDAGTWTLPLDNVPAGRIRTGRHRLPEHEPCERYEVSLSDARW